MAQSEVPFFGIPSLIIILPRLLKLLPPKNREAVRRTIRTCGTSGTDVAAEEFFL